MGIIMVSEKEQVGTNGLVVSANIQTHSNSAIVYHCIIHIHLF
jgi:hypothetical protein